MIRVLYAHDIVSARTPGPTCGPEASVQTEAERLEQVIRTEDMFTDFAKVFESGGEEQNGTLLTLDDGYRSVITRVKPLIERHGIVCIVFITTGFVGGDAIPYEYQLAGIIRNVSVLRVPRWVDKAEEWLTGSESEKRTAYETLRRKLKGYGGTKRSRAIDLIAEWNGSEWGGMEHACEFLSWDEVRELGEHPLFRIGAHTCTHPAMKSLPVKEARREIVQSKSQLEMVVGGPIECFAYPYGSNSRAVRVLVRRSGFRRAFRTGETGFSSWRTVNRFGIPRVHIDLEEV